MSETITPGATAGEAPFFPGTRAAGCPFDPPGGLLGYMITADSIRKDLQRLLAYRELKLKEIFG